MPLFLRVPYEEEDEAKALGARWDSWIEQWYVDVPRKEYVRFAKWILGGADEALIATDQIFIVEGQHTCWKCGMSTRVVGLGISGHIDVYDGGNGPWFERFEDDLDGELHLAWTDREERVPPRLLEYLMEKYSVRTGYSSALGRNCFANHCDHCGALQGNRYLFDDPDSPLVLAADGDELLERASKLKIFEIPISDDLLLGWDVVYSSTDDFYLEFGQCEELSLSDNSRKRSVSYNELRSRV